VNSRSKQKASANVRIQPPILVLIHIVLLFVLMRLAPLPLSVPPVLQLVGFLLAMIGFLLGLAALLAFRRAQRKPADRGRGTGLITTGIYRFTRHPVYLGFILILIGLSLSMGSYWGLLLAPIMLVLFNNLVVEAEEQYLMHKFGEGYTTYKAKVRRWL
jgi:protein-S-isoprenylcysteine O-methyltransferase Ste14